MGGGGGGRDGQSEPGEGETMSGMHVGVLIAKTPSSKRRNGIGRRVLN